MKKINDGATIKFIGVEINDNIASLLQEIEKLKPRLPMGTYEVMIEQPEEVEEKRDKPGFPNR